ncbi:MAG: penicillin-binding transpeptidase domain-containing protein [Clostridiales bacterium]|nr:penicillin-binding transpeptidase domain-containing protein [Clostridiales bacterium]
MKKERGTGKQLHRLWLFVTLFIAAAGALCYGSVQLATEGGEILREQVEKTSTETVYSAGKRGVITDRNGVVLAADEVTYNVSFYRDPTRRTPEDSARYTESLLTAIAIIEGGGGTVDDRFYIERLPDGSYAWDFGTDSETVQATRKRNFLAACGFSNPEITAEEAYLFLRDSWRVPDALSFAGARKLMSIRQEAVLGSYRAFAGVVIAEDVPVAVVSELSMRQEELFGIRLEKSSRRVYPQGHIASHIVGYLGRQVTNDMTTIGYDFAEFVPFVQGEATNDMTSDTLGYALSDNIGVAGVEKSMEAYLTPNLRSRRGSTRFEISRQGAIVDTIETVAPRDGLNVQLTIDFALQQVAERALLENIESTRAEQLTRINRHRDRYARLRPNLEDIKLASSGAVVVMDVNSGNILALASFPDYDPNLFTGGLSRENYELLFGENSNQATLNRAIGTRNAPGSSLKMATGFAGLMEGKITVDSRISDQSPYYYFVSDPTTKVEQNAPSCWARNLGAHANLTLSRALTVSCNYFFFTVADRVGIDRLVYWAGELGLSGTTGVQLPGELSVQVGGQAARYDYTKSLAAQSSSVPRLIYNRIVTQVQNILIQNGSEVDNERVQSCALKILQLQTGNATELGPQIRALLQSELNIPVGVTLSRGSAILEITALLEELRWKPTYTIQTGIGQGVSLLTPISLARYVSVLSNRGHVYKANLIAAITTPEGEIYELREPVLQNRIDAPPEYWDAILTGLMGVVSPEDGGTAGSVFSREFREKGYLDQIMGKTGTAQTNTGGANVDIENNSWFAAVAPVDNPQICVVVFIPNGISGSDSALAVERILTYWFENMANP